MDGKMIQPKRARLLTTVMAAGIFVAACSSGGASPAPTTGTSAAPASSAPAASTGASAPASSGAVTIPTPEKKSIKIGLSTSGETSQFAEKLADQLGKYKKYGFDSVEVSGFQGDGKVVQALVAGALDVGVIGVSSAISSVPTDTPLKVVALNGVTLTDGLYCASKYKTAADIKGQQVAVSTFGGTSHGSVLIMLAQLGLTDKDVTITQVGAQDARIAAVKAGSVACAPIDLSQDAAMTAAGLNKLTDNKSSGKQWGRSGMGVTADFAKNNPNTVLAVVAAVLDAQNSIWVDPATAATNFADYAQQKPADATKLIASFTEIGDRSMGWSDDAFNFPKQTLATTNPAMANVNVADAYDKSFLQKLFDMGFYTQINNPEKPFS
jgi:ABC-type nitrate/sulfonate/bicarbonate transport system substrate-binding protein